MKSIFRFWNELKRRNVHKGIISYVIFSWVLLQVISVLGSIINIPAWLGKTVLITLVVFLPFWLLFSWFYDITSTGLKKTSAIDGEVDEVRSEKIGKRLNIFILSFLSIAIILLIVDRSRLTSQQNLSPLVSSFETVNSIAVLPFKDISIKQNQAYFSDGLAEELINALSKITNIKVTTRTSAFSFKGQALDIPTIAKKLDVNYILEGSVRSHDSIVRVSVQLIDTKKDSYAWSETWDKELKNILQIQNEISTTIVDKLTLKISGDTIAKLKKVDPNAYKLYLQSRYELRTKRDVDGIKTAKILLEKSLQIDSTYAPSWELLSRLYHYQNNLGMLSIEEGYPLALNAGKKAIEKDSTLASVYDIMATIAIDYKKDFKKAEAYVNKGLAIEPNNAYVLDRAGEVASINGDLKKALEFRRKVAALNPLDSGSFYTLGLTHYWLKNYQAAEEAFKKTIALNPNSYGDYNILSIVLLLQGKHTQALEAALKETDDPFKLQALAMVHHALGNTVKAQKHLKTLIDKYEKDYSFQIATVYAFYKDKDKMFYWLEKGLFYKDFGLIESKTDPLYDFAKEDPRWPVFMKQIGFL